MMCSFVNRLARVPVLGDVFICEKTGTSVIGDVFICEQTGTSVIGDAFIVNRLAHQC